MNIDSLVGDVWLAKIDHETGRWRTYVRDMLEKGVQCYVPMNTELKKNGETVERPLFAGYAFIALAKGAGTYEAKCSKAFRQLIRVVEQVKLRAELREVEKALVIDPTLRIARKFFPGQAVQVLSGPFMGMSGAVEWINTKRLIMQVRVATMGTSVNIELPASALEPEG